MAGAPARDINRAKPISQRSRHGMPRRSISAPSRISAARSTEARARQRLADAMRLTGLYQRPSRPRQRLAETELRSHAFGRNLKGSLWRARTWFRAGPGPAIGTPQTD